ncbi:MFS transporter [Nonomuraea sp. NPDC005650]|uniref:MFS transporter n=1 Tax=Nonomuraea sp. NPDC005650 TaxID=3157045 RepID=UPI00339F361B
MTQDTALRRLLGAGFVDYLGGGLFLAFSAVYFTQVVGLSATQVGVGTGIAGVAAMAGAVPIGRVADRIGARRAIVVLHLARAAGTASYVLVGEWWGFLAAVAVVTVADQAIASLTQAYVAELAEGERRVRVLALYRTLANLGISVGGPLGGLLAGAGVFTGVLLANAGAFVVVAAMLATVRGAGGRGAGGRGATVREAGGRAVPQERRFAALRDRRLLAAAAVDGVLQLWLPVLNLGFPLWLARATGLPESWLGVLYAINTVLGMVLLVPAARLTATVAAARRCQLAAAVLMIGACLAFWGAGRVAPLALLVVAIVLLTAGELLSVPAAWTVSYALAPSDRRAEYISAYGMGRSVGRYVLGPVLITGLLDLAGGWMWAALAILFAGAGAAAVLVRARP